MKDPQRQRLYRAERILPKGQSFATVPVMDGYVNDLVTRPWFRHYWPHITQIHVGDGRRRRSAGGNAFTKTISMPKWSRHEIYILHEVAHVVSPSLEHHGKTFCLNLVRLVRHIFGDHQASLLHGSMTGRGCEVAKEDKPFSAKVAAAALKRQKPIITSVNGTTYHTHLDTLRIGHNLEPLWKRVNPKTGICTDC